MTSVTGQVTTFLQALGATNPDQRILDALVLVGPQRDEQADPDGETYWSFFDKGVDFLFRDDVLETVYIRPYPTDEGDLSYEAYPDMDKLIDGLPPTPTRADVEQRFGDPEAARPRWARYQVDGRYLHFAFDDEDDVVMISALRDIVR